MALNDAQKLLKLAMLATRRRGISLTEIVETFGCSHRQAQRMTKALEDAFPQTQQVTDDERRVHWLIPARAIAPLLTPSADELAALSTAIGELDTAGMTHEASKARALEQKVRALIPPDQETRLAVDEEALLEALGHAARPGPRPAANRTVDAAISEALKGPFLLRILYRKREEEEARERVVAPHGLLLGVRRYLVARDKAKPTSATLQHYRVEEIYQATVLPDSFELDAGFNIKRHAERGFGSYESREEYGEVIWRFKPEAAQHAKRYVFHPTQTVEDQDDGSVVVRFQASGHLEMCWHLYSWGTAVEIIAPAPLRDMVNGHQRAFAALP